MKKYFWVGLLFVAHSAFAIFEDEEARKKINSMQDQLNNIQSNIDYKVSQALKNQNLAKFQNEDDLTTTDGVYIFRNCQPHILQFFILVIY